jgi:hypothetical protein
MSCDLKPCTDLSSKKVDIHIQYANAVYQQMVEERYGLESCKKTRELHVLEIRKNIVDWQTLEDNFHNISTNELGLGRLHLPDLRDNNYLIENLNQYQTSTPISSNLQSTVIRNKTRIVGRYWEDEQWWGNQGSTSECVAYSWIHWLEDGPFYQATVPHPILQPNPVYKEAQKIDEWPGENYNGTSIRAGAKILQNLGFIQNYFWTFDVNVLANTVLNVGPVVVGTIWHRNMFFPDRRTGLIRATGPINGAHAYVINGVDTQRRLFRIKNSWGRNWGLQGRAFISFTDMARLMRMNGEVCLATEKTPG